MANAKPKTLRLTRSLIALAAGLMMSAWLAGCARDATPDAPILETLTGQNQDSGPEFCVETATNVPAIGEWAPIVDLISGEPLPGSLLEALERVKLTRRWLDLPDLPLLISDFESMVVGDYEELLTHDFHEPDDAAYDLILRSPDGISDVPGSRNAIVYVAHLRAADEPESWYVFDWRYELPCPPEES